MAFNISFGLPKISFKKVDSEATSDSIVSIFTSKTFIILGAGIAIGIIAKQQSDIHTLRRTVQYLQEVIR